jgi:negative regulator of sigma E activity
MTCRQVKLLLSSYLDSAMTGKLMLSMAGHLDACQDCQQEYLALRQTQRLLSSVPRPKAPADLTLKLRLAISREAARSQQNIFSGLRVRAENVLNAFMVPATAGLATAVVIFGFLMGFVALPLQAGSADVPTMLNTAPQLQASAFGTTLDSIKDDSLVIEAYVDANGRVQDYRVLSNPNANKDLPPQVKNMLIFTTFRPATSMGRPTSGTAVLSFSRISVRG